MDGGETYITSSLRVHHQKLRVVENHGCFAAEGYGFVGLSAVTIETGC